MKQEVLDNGMVILSAKKQSETVALQVMVKVGSNNEHHDNNGISHFVEHMLFEGTKKRKDALTITNEIERVGGDINAYTSNEKTCYYIKVPKRHFNKALDILGDILIHCVFPKRSVEKERKVILKEINLHRDEPRSHQWVMFQKLLFKKHPAGLPTYGNEKAVRSIRRKDLVDFYRTYYVGSNVTLSVVGNFPAEASSSIKKYFGKLPSGKVPPKVIPEEPVLTQISEVKEFRKIHNSYLVLGYKTPARTDKDAYVLDVIQSILGRGQSGRLFEEIRNKRGLAYEVGAQHDCGKDYGFFAVYLNTSKKNITTAIGVILQEFKKLARVGKQDMADAKGNLIGQHILENEDTQALADEFSYWGSVGNARLSDRYLKNIARVMSRDVARVAKKFLTRYYALAVIEQKK